MRVLLRWSLPWSFRTWWCFYHSSCIPHKSTQLILHLMLKYCIGSGKSSSQGIQCWRKVTQVQKTAFVLSWLQSLSGKYQVRFPAKSLLPNSEEVLSFSIYGITQSFLKFWYRKCSPLWCKVEIDSETPHSFLSSLPIDEAWCSCQWECLKVLSSSSAIDLVLWRS